MPYASIVVQQGRAVRGNSWLVWLGAFLAVACYRFVASLPVLRNADDANNFLAGIEMVHGNWLLAGWRLAPDNFAPTDILLQGIASLLLGRRPVVIDAVETLIWAAVAMIAAGLAIRDIAGRARLPAAMVTLSLVIVGCRYSDARNAALTGVGSHGSSILLIMLAFQSAAAIERAWSDAGLAPKGRLAILLALVAIGSFADPLFTVIGAVPLLLACLLHWRIGRARRPVLLIAGSIIAGLLLSRLLLALVHQAGGFGSDTLDITFATLPALLDHVQMATICITGLFGAEFFGATLSADLISGPALSVVRFGFVLALGLVLVRGAADLFRCLPSWPHAGDGDPGAASFLDTLLWVSIVFCIAGSVLTTVMADATSVRFFLPVLVAGSILIVRRVWSAPVFAAYASLTGLATIVVGVVALVQDPGPANFASPASWRLVAALRQAGLHHGYAGYWDSSLTTMLTRGDIQTLALIETPPGTIEPMQWFANLDWYHRAASGWHGRVFFIARTHPGSAMELDHATIVRRFGPPAQTIDVGESLVDIYELHDGMLAGLNPPG